MIYDWLINTLLPSVLASLIVSLLMLLIRKPPNGLANWRGFIKLFGIFILVCLIIFTYVIPPYSITNTSWCLTSQGTTEVKGYVIHSIFRRPAMDVTIQVKIFPAGSSYPLQDREFGNTDVNGVFFVELKPPQPTRGMYLINTAYNFDSPFWRDRWYIKDFGKSNPPACKER